MITYRETHTYKYILDACYRVQLPSNFIGKSIESSFIEIKNCEMQIRDGYRWDGPSGPTFDTKTFMRGSLVHDCLYQLIREGHLEPRFRKIADKLLIQHCKEDGMFWGRRQWVYYGLRIGGKSSTKPKTYDVQVAP